MVLRMSSCVWPISSGVTFVLFFMIRLPPRSTLFPYTTLFRSLRRLHYQWRFLGIGARDAITWRITPKRSEEHTSELQSRPHLGCRLLLEKKKTAKIKLMEMDSDQREKNYNRYTQEFREIFFF